MTLTEKLGELNKLFADKAAATVILEKETALKKAIAEVNNDLIKTAYEAFSDVKELILAPTIEGYALKVERSEGVQTGYSIDSHKVLWLSISGWLSKHHIEGLSKSLFESYIRKGNITFLARVAVDAITVSRDENIKKWKGQVTSNLGNISDSPYMSRLAQNIIEGKTVLSNTALSKLLQSLVDLVAFEDFGNGSNKYKVKNCHVKSLLSTVLEWSKAKVGCFVSRKDKTFERSFLHVLNVIVRDAEFAIDGSKTKKMDEKRPLDWNESDDKIFEEVKSESTAEA